MKKVSKEKKWQDKWYRYVEFLRRNGYRPNPYEKKGNEDLYVWFENNLDKFDEGKLTEAQHTLFENRASSL